MIRAFLVVAALVGISWLIALTIGFVREWRRSREPRPFLRFERHSEYGSHLRVGRVRFGSRRTMTPMWPHVYKGGDEWCNDVLCFHLYPLVSIDIWWQLKQRTAKDGICDTCKDELRGVILP